MLARAFLRNGLGLLVPLAIACSVYLYLYPFFSRCAFPLPSRDPDAAFEETKKLHWPFEEAKVNTQANVTPTRQAPFRLLALGDPQLEGDTSIPIEYLGIFPHVKTIFQRLTFHIWHESLRDRVRLILHDVIDIFFEDIPFIFESWRKRFDLFGNDFYLAHIYRTLHWWTQPTHVGVLGDLLGSQWIEDDEFERRGRRFWNRTFRGGERVPDDVAMWPTMQHNLSGILGASAEGEVWKRRIMNVAGNHDIGYAGDLTPERMQRFERVFGKANYELRFRLPVSDPETNATIRDPETNPDSARLPPELRIIVLNDMNLDTPAKDQGLQDTTYNFVNAVIGTACAVEHKGQFTLILTHIPLYKSAGVCVDSPFFDFHGAHDGGGVKEQYLLSSDASKGFLEGIFGISRDPKAAGQGMGRPGLVLSGHDHEGCDTYHFVNQTNGTTPDERSWESRKWQDAMASNIQTLPQHPGRREITVRSMMGDFGGNAGLLSIWFNQQTWEWEHAYVDCPLGRQHFWWMTHFIVFGVLFFGLSYVVVAILESMGVDVDAHLHQASVWTRHQLEEWEKKRRAHKTGVVPNGNSRGYAMVVGCGQAF
ncbi:Metallophosphoesterase domain protein [Metarhizium album ARSEF 1941]|uniref:Metallophosphoesterase domain protein n=1 Tax=Metarhizium album (strain ARSEF 1941) TaxID=1081103 RepID=A0A0B2WNK9_METAS|nr:Metallophosphoesterase domain protein [Metarhizium album ARSEF 1941]KHN95563.1 Metallophosphoesterase domain protein [Metarhizium album ARSEF 1941]